MSTIYSAPLKDDLGSSSEFFQVAFLLQKLCGLSLEFGRGEGKEMQVEAEENDFLFVKSGYFCF